MAVPSAVTNRREREADALRGQGIDPDSGAPIAIQQAGVQPTPAAPSVAVPAPVATPPVDDAAALRARNAELEAELRTQGGRVSSSAKELEELKARFELINENRVFLQNTVTELTDKVDTLTKQPPTPAPEPIDKIVSALDGEGPTEAQIKDFGDSVDFVERVVRKQLSAVVKPLIERLASMESVLARVKDIDAKLPRLEETAKVTEINTARQRELEFLQKEVLPYFKDFETTRATTEWKAYLAKDTGRGFTVGDLLKSYRQTGDAVGIRSLLGTFYDAQQSKPSLDSLAVPAKTGVDTPPAPLAPKMKASEYKTNLRAFTHKKMPKDQWEAYRARWDEAIATGNVEMDVEIR